MIIILSKSTGRTSNVITRGRACFPFAFIHGTGCFLDRQALLTLNAILTGDAVGAILLSSKSYMRKVTNSKINKVNRSASSWQCGISVRDSGWHFTALEAVLRAGTLFLRTVLSAWKGGSQ